MIFKVDFEKAYDSLRWEFLDLVMAKVRFGFKWRRWIEGCLLNAHSSILVNAAPTDEFEICRGLRQGDPLFKDALIDERGLLMSHSMYADDVIFMRDWYKLLGVGVDHEESSELASILGCRVSMFPFTYLGGRLTLSKAVLGNLPTYYMSLYKIPSAIERNLESMRNNFFIGGDLEDKKITRVAWKKCLASKEHCGLGVGSIFALNRTLISASSPWIAILKATKHLTEKGIDLLSLCKRKVGHGSLISFWDDDWCGDGPLKLQFPRVYALDDAKSCIVVKRLRLLDWLSVFRWPLRGGGSDGFSVASARGFIDDMILDVDYVATRWNRLDHAKVNVFFWRLNLKRIPTIVNLDRRGSKGISWVKWSKVCSNKNVGCLGVGSLKAMNLGLSGKWIWRFLNEQEALWRKHLVLALNIASPDYMHWKLIKKLRVPTYPNLARRGVALASTICMLCKMEEESVSHRFITYSFSNSIWKKLESWWNITLPQALNLNAIARNTVVSGGGNSSVAKVIHGVCFILVWII
nr:RNA-directed DNA polymerase, eukaryota, reverse transcriptase zinc-binding domain protein [Tanacetum cinerariifolium]